MRRPKALLALGVMVTAGLVPVFFATAAYANTVAISINCQSVTFNYAHIPTGTDHTTETVTVNGATVVDDSFPFSTTTGTYTSTVSYSGANGNSVTAAATFTTADGNFHNSATTTLSGCVPPPPPCPPGTNIHIRWHYSGMQSNGSYSAGSWSATTGFTCPSQVSMGPQAMEGNLQLAPGATLKAGYDFTIPGDNNSVTVTFTSPEVTFDVGCANGSTPTTSTVVVPMPTQSYTSTNGGNWYPSGDQSSSLVYQGSISVPNVCNGGNVSFQNGGTFTASIS
jgi:hypothetical protein